MCFFIIVVPHIRYMVRILDIIQLTSVIRMRLQIPPVTQLCIQQIFIRFLIIIGERTAMIQFLKMSGLPFFIPVQRGTIFKEERFFIRAPAFVKVTRTGIITQAKLRFLMIQFG